LTACRAAQNPPSIVTSRAASVVSVAAALG